MFGLIDFSFSMIIFNARHGMFLFLYLTLYYTFDFFNTRYLVKTPKNATYECVKLDWIDISDSFIIISIHLIMTLLIFYILYLVS